MSSYDCRPAAHAYLDLGLAVGELQPCSKIPYGGSRGVYGATKNRDEVERFNPKSNLFVACGSVSGVAVTDVDPRNRGDVALDDLERRHGRFVRAPFQRSGRGDGGHHRFCAYPVGGVRSCDLAPGVELLSDGKYVLVWPSVHPETGGMYMHDQVASIFTMPLAPLPQWVIDIAGRGGTIDYGQPTGASATSFLGTAFRAAGWLGRELPNGKIVAVCPWASEHGVHDGERRGIGADSSAVILPPTEKTPLGAFKCRHGECETRRTRDALAALPDVAVRAALDAHPDLFALARRIVLIDRRPS